jgi:alpha-galactosidase
MKKLIAGILLPLLLSCGREIPRDRLLSGNRTLKDIAAVVETSASGSMNIRTVAFVNNGPAPVSIDAMETSLVEIKGADVWTFQPSSTSERKDWAFPVENGFYQRNYLGMNNSDYGGGIPMVCLWTKDRSISVGLAEPTIKLVSMPVERKGNVTRARIRQDFETPVILQPGDTLRSFRQFVMEGTGDFFQPLRNYTSYMKETFGFASPVSPESAYEPVWCAW